MAMRTRRSRSQTPRNARWDRSGAEKALRKAVELDASDLEPQMELAILSEYDSQGDRYSQLAPLQAAVEQYRSILTKGPNAAVSQNLAALLLHMGRVEEARQEIEKLNGQPPYPVLELESTALTSGADSAILQTQSGLDPAARAQILSQAGWELLQLRRYPEGLALLHAAQRVSSSPQVAAVTGLYGRVERFDKLLDKDDSPKLPVEHFLALVADDHAGEKQFREVLAEDADWSVWQPRIEKLRAHLASLGEIIRSNGGSVAVLPDLVVSWNKVSVEGEGKPAYRITTISNGLPSVGVGIYYVVSTPKGFRILATADGLDGIGRRVLTLLKRGDLATAQQWLDLLNGNALPEMPRDDKGPAVRYLWAGVAPETRNATFVRAAAASLLGTYTGSEDAIRILREIAPNPPRYMDRTDLQFAICEALHKAERWKELLQASRPLLNVTVSTAPRATTVKPTPGSRIVTVVPNHYVGTYGEVAMGFFGEAAVHTNQWDALQKIVDARLKAWPKDHPALQYAALLAMHKRDFAAAGKWIEQASSAGYMQPIPDTLLRDWNQILSNSVRTEDTNDLNQSTLFSGSEEDLFTQALLQLRAGKEDEFHRLFALALARSDDRQSDGIPWLVEAELLRHYGLEEEAAQALDRVHEAKNFGELDWAAVLLQTGANPADSSQAGLVN